MISHMQQTRKEYKTRHDWVGKMIHWELCKDLIFDHPVRWYMHNSISVLENETHKFHWNFEIQTDHLILDRRPGMVIIYQKKKRICQIVDFASWLTTESKSKKRQILRFSQRTKKAKEHEGDCDISHCWCTSYDPQKLSKRLQELEIKRQAVIT